MSDYGVDFPVWNLDHVLDTDYALSAGDLDVTSQLSADLIQWQRLFDEHFHWEDGWRGPAARDEYAALGPRLWDRLQAELGPDFDVVLDLWPAEAS